MHDVLLFFAPGYHFAHSKIATSGLRPPRNDTMGGMCAVNGARLVGALPRNDTSGTNAVFRGVAQNRRGRLGVPEIAPGCHAAHLKIATSGARALLAMTCRGASAVYGTQFVGALLAMTCGGAGAVNGARLVGALLATTKSGAAYSGAGRFCLTFPVRCAKIIHTNMKNMIF